MILSDFFVVVGLSYYGSRCNRFESAAASM